MPDFECTWWPDTWFGISLTQCCIEHDLGGSDLDLFHCVAAQHPALVPIAAAMLVGVVAWRVFRSIRKL